MKFRLLFLLICLLSFGQFADLSAQTTRTDRAKDRAENRANRRVDNKIDNKVDGAVDDAFNAIGGLFKKKDKKKETDQDNGANANEDAAANAAMGSLFGGGEDWEPYTNPRNFSLSWNMVTTKRNGKTEAMNMDIAVTEDKSAVKIINPDKPKENSRMILDTQTGKTTMVSTDNNGEQSAVRMRMPNMKKAIEKEMAKQNPDGTEMSRWTFEETNERMEIDGYDCRKVVVTDTETGDVTTSWITTDTGLSQMEMTRGMAASFGGGQIEMPANSPTIDGVLIKSTTVTDKETIELHITNIKLDGETDRSIMNLLNIPVTDVGF